MPAADRPGKDGPGRLGSLLTPILALVLPVAQAVGGLLPMGMVRDMFALYTYWKEWELDLVRCPVVAVALLSWLSTARGPSRE